MLYDDKHSMAHLCIPQMLNTILRFCFCLLLQACSIVSNSAVSWTVASQASLSMEFSRQEYWSGLPFVSPSSYCICFLSPNPLSPHSWINTWPLPLPSSRLFGNYFCLLSSWTLLSTFSFLDLDLWFLDAVYSSLHCFGSTSVLRSWKSKMSVFYPPTWLVAWIYNSRFRNISFQIVK